MANPYKTHWYNRRAGHWLSKEVARPPGHTRLPEVIRLEPTAPPSDAPPVRIYVGTEPGQYRATRVFVWSVLRHRDPSRAYEIYLMSDLKGIGREGWKTGFTSYRYLIPALAGGEGRAIYNDVDQIYLSDPAGLFDLDMHGKGVLAITKQENSVMLIDCALMANHWTRADVAAGKRHAHFKNAVVAEDLFGPLPESWNSLDGSVPVEHSDLLHYTTLHTQPWKPFPTLLRYEASPHSAIWHELEREADKANFLLFTREHPSRQAGELVELYRQMHAGGPEIVAANPQDPEPFDGRSLRKHVERIGALIQRHKAVTVLDYGAGKASEYEPLAGADPSSAWRSKPEWPSVTVRCYDPGHPPFAELDAAKHDGVISIDVVEHLAPFDVPWVLDEIATRARSFVYLVAACYPARKVLPDGQNAHSVQQPPHWWHSQMALAMRRYSQLDWVLVCETKSRAGKSRIVFDRSSPDPLA
jgi:hypothetical protein